MTIKIGIVMPAYNVGQYVGETLDSLLAQTYPHWVACVVNDGSNDNTRKVIESYAKKDDRITLINTTNKGVSAARNVALDFFEQEEDVTHIAFLDCDDYFSNHCLELVVKEFSNSSIDSLSFGYAYFDTKRIWTETKLESRKYLSEKKTVESFCLLNHDLIPVPPTCATSKFLANRVFSKNVLTGIRFDESLKMAEDQQFLFDVSGKINTLLMIPEVCLYYRQRTSSACFQANLEETRRQIANLYKKNIDKYRHDEYLVAVLVNLAFTAEWTNLRFATFRSDIKEMQRLVNSLRSYSIYKKYLCKPMRRKMLILKAPWPMLKGYFFLRKLFRGKKLIVEPMKNLDAYP